MIEREWKKVQEKPGWKQARAPLVLYINIKIRMDAVAENNPAGDNRK